MRRRGERSVTLQLVDGRWSPPPRLFVERTGRQLPGWFTFWLFILHHHPCLSLFLSLSLSLCFSHTYTPTPSHTHSLTQSTHSPFNHARFHRPFRPRPRCRRLDPGHPSYLPFQVRHLVHLGLSGEHIPFSPSVSLSTSGSPKLRLERTVTS